MLIRLIYGLKQLNFDSAEMQWPPLIITICWEII